MSFNKTALEKLVAGVFGENRNQLLEHENYDLMEAAGLPSGRKVTIVAHPGDVTQGMLSKYPGDRIVLKIVAPVIMHKTDVGGVAILAKDLKTVQSGVADMLAQVPGRFATWIEKKGLTLEGVFEGLSGKELAEAVNRDIRGVMVTDFAAADEKGFGYEMIVGIQNTREFGPVITAGIGGVDTELVAASMTQNQAAVTGSALERTPQQFLDKFRSTICYRKIAGLTRAGRKVVSDGTLLQMFDALFAMARHFGPDGASEFVMDEFEINPVVFTGGVPAPLDGLSRFHRRPKATPQSPLHKLTNLLHPKSMAVIGVSAKGLNMGRIILRNIKGQGFDEQHMYVIRPETDEIDGIRCIPSIAALPEIVDVLVLAVGADQAPGIIEEAAGSGKVQSVIIIPGGLGEKSGTEAIVAGMNRAIADSRMRQDGGPLFVGGNCLGIISRPALYDTLFVPEQKLPKNYDKTPDPVAFLSQSGARMITVISSQSNMAPLFSISTGNQMDLGISDFLEYMVDHEPEVKVFAVYVEGFRNLGGLKAVRAVKRLADQGRQVIFYKAGRTAAGRTATSGHTASVAGNYPVCAALMEDAGAMVCDNFTEFNELTRLALALKDKKVTGNRLAAISNAGYETVGMADNIEGDWPLSMAVYAPKTAETIAGVLKATKLDTLVDVRNPMDLTPMGNDDAHEGVIRAQLADPNVDCFLAATVPLTPAQKTLPAGLFGTEDILTADSYPNRLIRIFRETNKPVIFCIDSGQLYDPMVRMMEQAGLVVFRTADLAIRMLAKYIHSRLRNS
ncbi:acetate--CoA ligase family protein [bacterium]|nr:acetate--CoA ligase family protein [candidate division CSSED10-310 bacterium]